MTNLDPLQQQRGRALTDDQLLARWREYVESHVAQEIAAEHEFMIQIVGGALGEFSAQLRAEVGRTIASKLGHAKGPKGERGEELVTTFADQAEAPGRCWLSKLNLEADEGRVL
jgi:hypothetical protein